MDDRLREFCINEAARCRRFALLLDERGYRDHAAAMKKIVAALERLPSSVTA
ncbi:MAG: hypothetical protein ACREEN_00405 [Stellaceae bacterium]